MNKKESLTILIVDDNPITQKITQRFLEGDGFKVVSAWDGGESVDLVKKEKPDCILMDVILPDGDGKEFAQQIKSLPETKETAMIFITNTVPLSEDKGFESFSIDGVVYRAFAKPLHEKKILNTIRKEINRMKQGGDLSPKITDKPPQNE